MPWVLFFIESVQLYIFSVLFSKRDKQKEKKGDRVEKKRPENFVFIEFLVTACLFAFFAVLFACFSLSFDVVKKL